MIQGPVAFGHEAPGALIRKAGLSYFLSQIAPNGITTPRLVNRIAAEDIHGNVGSWEDSSTCQEEPYQRANPVANVQERHLEARPPDGP